MKQRTRPIGRRLEEILEKHYETRNPNRRSELLSKILIEHWPELKALGQAKVEAIVNDTEYISRLARSITEDDPEWAELKRIREQEYLLEMGYTPGYHRDIKHDSMD